MNDDVLAIDVGGANIKVCSSRGDSASQFFPLWKDHENLAQVLQPLLARFQPWARLAVTMTGELADCYPSKRAGVASIVDAVEQAVGTAAKTGYYTTQGKFVDAMTAKSHWSDVAAANWHALATYATRFISGGSGLLVDIGSTTTDLIPMRDGLVVGRGKTDMQRLAAGELVYWGMERTPICGVTSTICLGGQDYAIAREWFATTQDAFCWLGAIDEDTSRTDTCDGRPLTREWSAARLARMLCADRADLSDAEITVICETVIANSVALIDDAATQVVHRLEAGSEYDIVLTGHGEYLFARTKMAVSARTIHRLAGMIGSAAARCGPAYALAQLAIEEHRWEFARDA